MARKNQEYKELSIKEFSKAALIYDNKNAGIYNTCKKNYLPILKRIEERPFSSLLDVGCGTGAMIELISKSHPSSQFVGLDLTPKMVEIASKKNIKNAKFVVGDAENLPFEKNSFDLVICLESFHHYPNPENFFASVHRVLTEDGILILQDYTAEGLLNFMINKIEMPLVNKIGHGDVGVRNKKELYELVDNANLKVLSFKRKGVKMTMVISQK